MSAHVTFFIDGMLFYVLGNAEGPRPHLPGHACAEPLWERNRHQTCQNGMQDKGHLDSPPQDSKAKTIRYWSRGEQENKMELYAHAVRPLASAGMDGGDKAWAVRSLASAGMDSGDKAWAV
eukprot:366051-Chlamydomonas_euryale.AAC.11